MCFKCVRLTKHLGRSVASWHLKHVQIKLWFPILFCRGLPHEEATALTNSSVLHLLLLRIRRSRCSLLRPPHPHRCSLRSSPQPLSQLLFHFQCILLLSLSACAQYSCIQSWTHKTEQFTTSQRLTMAYLELTYLH